MLDLRLVHGDVEQMIHAIRIRDRYLTFRTNSLHIVDLRRIFPIAAGLDNLMERSVPVGVVEENLLLLRGVDDGKGSVCLGVQGAGDWRV